jgi:hypothetical protein
MGRKKVSHVVSRSLKICCCQGQWKYVVKVSETMLKIHCEKARL